MPCDRFETGKLDHRSSTSTRIEFILSRTVCVAKLNPKTLSRFQLCEFLTIHRSLNSAVKLIQCGI